MVSERNEWEVEDYCVGEREKDKDGWGQKQPCGGGQYLDETCVSALLFWEIIFMWSAGSGILIECMNAHLPAWFGRSSNQSKMIHLSFLINQLLFDRV